MNVSLVIPAYNEADRLPPSIAKIADYLRAKGETWEVIVVDDGSGDATPAAART
ncbi:MAG: glycosyltransferase, partial [Thermoanaerobaculia bacterium]